MTFVIVNCDDLGLHPAVRRAVYEGHARGAITSASVLANGPDLGNVIRDQQAGRFAGLGLGAHLNILRGAPVSQPHEVPSLVDLRGRFLNDYWKLFGRFRKGQVDPADIEREWSLQVATLRAAGLSLTHIDSEKHIHAWPGLMEIACRVAGHHGIPWVRLPREHTSAVAVSAPSLKAKLLTFWSRKYVKGRVAVLPDHPDLVWGIRDRRERRTTGRFLDYVRAHPAARVVEIVCHPGLVEAEDPPIDPGFGAMTVDRDWAVEAASLFDGDWPFFAARHGLVLTHYGELAPRRADALEAAA